MKDTARNGYAVLAVLCLKAGDVVTDSVEANVVAVASVWFRERVHVCVYKDWIGGREKEKFGVKNGMNYKEKMSRLDPKPTISSTIL